MKALIFLLLSLQRAAQNITIGPCAGENPLLVFSGGPEFGEVQMVVGENPIDGEYFSVWHGEGQSILTIEIWFSINHGREKWFVDFISDRPGEIATFGNFHNLERGDVIYLRYIVKHKPIKRA